MSEDPRFPQLWPKHVPVPDGFIRRGTIFPTVLRDMLEGAGVLVQGEEKLEMGTREELIEAIEEYAADRVAWSHETRFGQKRPSPEVEDFVGHLLPDADGTPAGMEQYGWEDAKGYVWRDQHGELDDKPLTPLYRFHPSAVPPEPVEADDDRS